MIRYSVLVPQRDAPEAIAEQLPQLRRVLDTLTQPYEVLCIDDGSAAETGELLRQLLARFAFLRVLRIEQSVGVSVALSAGIAAARGEVLVAIAPGAQYSAERILHLIAALSRGDLAFGRRPSTRLAKFWQRVARLPRQLLLGLDVRDPSCLFWAARREAVVGLELSRGMSRYLPALVAMRGFRVTEVAVPAQTPIAGIFDARPNPGDLLAVWWMRRRYRPAKVTELHLVSPGAPAVPAPSRWFSEVNRPQDSPTEMRRRDTA